MDVSWEDAIKRGDVDVVCDLLLRGIGVDAKDRYGQTGLMLAAQAGHRDVVQTLIDHGANLNVTAKYGLSALMFAVIAGHQDIARVLGKAGADLSYEVLALLGLTIRPPLTLRRLAAWGNLPRS